MRVYLTILLALGKLPPLIPASPAPQQLGTWKTPGLVARHSAFPTCTEEDEMLSPGGDPFLASGRTMLRWLFPILLVGVDCSGRGRAVLFSKG